MQKVEREIFRTLANEVDFTLCAFCHFSKSEPGNSPCDCGEPYCVHPLADRFKFQYSSYGLEPGDDCWGFRPEHDIPFCADVIGIILQNRWASATWWQNKKGIWKITGEKLSV